MAAVTGQLRWAAMFLALMIVPTALNAQPAMAGTPQVTFSGTVYFKNDVAPYAIVSISYGMTTYTTKADASGNYTTTVDYVGGDKAVLTASYDGSSDVFTWYPAPDVQVVHDFWIAPRPPRPSWTSDVTFKGRVFYNDSTVKDAHVIIIYGNYLLDTYTNDTGYYHLLIYYQHAQARIWATYGDGRSEDYWVNTWPNTETMTDIPIAPGTLPQPLQPMPTPTPTGAPGNATPTASVPPGTATPAGSPTTPVPGGMDPVFGALAFAVAIAAASVVMHKRLR